MLDPRNNPLDKTNFHLFDPFRTINNNNNHLDKSRKQASETYEVEGIKLGLLESELGDESGIHSPPLWKNNHNQIPQSPISRRQAIITGQRELMDMVKNIPESSYELSLKDLVQNQEQYLLKNDEEDYDDDDDEEEQVVVQVQSNNKKREIKRAYSVDNNNKGLFLKMVFPVGNCSSNNKSKKKNIVVLNSSSSKGLSGNGKTSKSVEKYWWKKRFSVSKSESDSSSRSSSSHSRSNTSGSSRSNTSGSISSSSSHGSTNSRERTSMLTSCMTCFHSSKKQSAE